MTGNRVDHMIKFLVLSVWMVSLFGSGIAIAGVLRPCNIVAYANANAYIQAPAYYQQIAFEAAVVFTTCNYTDPADGKIKSPLTTATIIVANPPQNPPPTAPVYMNLYSTGSSSTQLLLMQGTTVITKSDFPTWFPDNSTSPPTNPSVTGVAITCPSTPWVPSSITVIWQ